MTHKEAMLKLLERHKKTFTEWVNEGGGDSNFTSVARGALDSVTVIINQINSGLLEKMIEEKKID